MTVFPADFWTRRQTIYASSWYNGFKARLNTPENKQKLRDFLTNVHAGYSLKQWHWDLPTYDRDNATDNGPSPTDYFSRDFQNDVGDARGIIDKGKRPEIESIHA